MGGDFKNGIASILMPQHKSPERYDRSGASSWDNTKKIVPSSYDSSSMTFNQLLHCDGHLLLHCHRIVYMTGNVEQLEMKNVSEFKNNPESYTFTYTGKLRCKTVGHWSTCWNIGLVCN